MRSLTRRLAGLAFCTAGLASATSSQCLVQRLSSPEPELSNAFGSSLAISGDRTLVGVPRDDDAALLAGAVYVLERAGGEWILADKLFSPQPVPGDYMGGAVALEGSRALVGCDSCYGIPPGGTEYVETGTAFVYELGPEGWEAVATLVPSTGLALDEFGGAVALDGDVALVGAPEAGPGNDDTGSAHVFRRTPTGWVEEAVLTPPGSTNNERFGTSVALDGDRAVVGAPRDFVAGAFTGAAYVFERSGTDWNFVQNLGDGVATGSSDFGEAVALRGDTLVVGAPDEQLEIGDETGAVHVFEFQGTSWVDVQRIGNDVGPFSDDFGVEVALGDDVLVVAQSFSLSTVLTYTRSEGTWMQTESFVPVANPAGGGFGRALSVDGDTVMIGASFEKEAVPSSGAVYVVSLGESDCADILGGPSTLRAGFTSWFTVSLRAPVEVPALYFLLGSASGTSPGAPSGTFTLPLNPDAYLLFLLQNPNAFIPDSFAFLDSEGEAQTSVLFPGSATGDFAGLTLHHAYVLLDIFDGLKTTYVSDAVSVTFVP